MARIYTRHGDEGFTGLKGGQRVAKDCVRIEANGALDELNCHLGTVRCALPPEETGDQGLILRVQRALMSIMSHVATPAPLRASNRNQWEAGLASELEESIDRLMEAVGQRPRFMIPGSNSLSSMVHVARAVARRAERRLCTLHREESLPEGVLPLINRLGDYLYALALYHSPCAEGWVSQPLLRQNEGPCE